MKKFTTLLALTLACCASSVFAGNTASFQSYTKAYRASAEANQPMLVVLNPGKDTDACVDVGAVKATDALEGYVVAEIDVTTPHGQQVHELFNSPPLPHTVVISDAKKQVFKTHGQWSVDQVSGVLNTYRDGGPTTVTAAKPVVSGSQAVILGTQPVVPASSYPAPQSYSAPMSIQSYTPSYAPPADCPSCRRNQSYRF